MKTQPYLAILSLGLLLGGLSGCYDITIILPEAQLDQPGDQPGGDQPGGDQPGGDQPGGDQPGGDQPPLGEDIFVANGCFACHGDDGGTGFAPDIRGASFDELDYLRGSDTSHPGGWFPDLSDEDLDALMAFLADAGNPPPPDDVPSDQPGDDPDDDAHPADQPGDDYPPNDTPTDPPATGWAFVANGCFACHGDDGSRHSIRGSDFGKIDSHLRDPDTRHPGGWFDLTDEEVEDIVAFLADVGGDPGDDFDDDSDDDDADCETVIKLKAPKHARPGDTKKIKIHLVESCEEGNVGVELYRWDILEAAETIEVPGKLTFDVEFGEDDAPEVLWTVVVEGVLVEGVTELIGEDGE